MRQREFYPYLPFISIYMPDFQIPFPVIFLVNPFLRGAPIFRLQFVMSEGKCVMRQIVVNQTIPINLRVKKGS